VKRRIFRKSRLPGKKFLLCLTGQDRNAACDEFYLSFTTMPEDVLDWLVEIIGWIGSVEILLAYGLNSYQKIRSDSLAFSLLNLTGGLFLMLYTIYKDAFANTFVNLVWVVIAVIALGRYYQRKRAMKKI
jgi:hypothetical protein